MHFVFLALIVVDQTWFLFMLSDFYIRVDILCLPLVVQYYCLLLSHSVIASLFIWFSCFVCWLSAVMQCTVGTKDLNVVPYCWKELFYKECCLIMHLCFGKTRHATMQNGTWVFAVTEWLNFTFYVSYCCTWQARMVLFNYVVFDDFILGLQSSTCTKMHIWFWLWLCPPDAPGGAYSAPHTP